MRGFVYLSTILFGFKAFCFDSSLIPPQQLLDHTPARPSVRINLKDGLSLIFSQLGTVYEVKVNGKSYGMKKNWLSGFFLRDVKKDILYPLKGRLNRLKEGMWKQSVELKDASLLFQAIYESHRDYIKVRGNIKDISGNDRAITIYFALPIDAIGWFWWDDIETKLLIEEGREYSNVEKNCPFGANGKH
ncbi:MAG: hypothetical protein ACPL7E_07385, partial [bacterium]